MKPVVIVDHAKKRFSRRANTHLSYGASDLFRELFGKKASTELRKDEFWAVNDISFALEQGDSLALIGRNGSGKSTLLMMMNGFLKPDHGSIVMDGRVQALINLGAGFDMNLSGYDNIYNSAALMGLTSPEIRALIEEIIDFSELEDCIDSPVGTYSSGMKARLGFSVAISLKPDILLIDEILSVGDYSFQNKCFVKMHELKHSGVTILLVSHSHTSSLQLCERALWIEHGQCVKMGATGDVVKAYLDFMNKETAERAQQLSVLQEKSSHLMKEKARRVAANSLYDGLFTDFDRIDELEFSLSAGGKETNLVALHDEVEIKYSFKLLKRVSDLNVTLCIYTKDGLKVAAISTLNGDILKGINEGTVQCRVRIPDFNLNPGEYVMVMPIHEGKSFLWRGIVHEFVVSAPNKLTWDLVDFSCEYYVEAPAQHRRRVDC